MTDLIKSYNNTFFNNLNIWFIRRKYLDQIEQSLNIWTLVKVIIWQRRVWKSFILRQLVSILFEKFEVKQENILYLNFESEKLSFIKNKNILQESIDSYFENISWRKYIFLDEVQEIDWWEKLVNSLRADESWMFEIFISWSNSKLLSWELATYLSWRYIEFEIFSFDFSEYLAFFNKEISKNNFLEYVNFSWLPELYILPNKDLQYSFVKSLFDTIILKDLVKRYAIKEVDLLEKIFLFLVNNIWNSFSVNNLRKKLLQEGIKISASTLWNYTKYFQDIFVFKWVSRYDLHWKKFLEWEKKYYLNDLWFLNFLFSSFENFISKKLENYVYNFFVSNWYSVYIGKMWNLEIDFIAEKNWRKIYIQVCYLLASDDVIEREYAVLRKIKDSFEKYIISVDDFEFPIDSIGIKHLQMWRMKEVFGQ